MSLFTRIANVFRSNRLNSEIEEELQSHIAEAIAEGRDPEEARRAFGSSLRPRESSHTVRVVGWLDSLRADVEFGWRQLKRHRVTSVAAVLSLALAMGSCVAAFRLMDALLWRPLPVANANRLSALSREGIDITGKFSKFDGWAYPDFELMRDASRGQADLVAASYVDRSDLTYGSDNEMEKAHVQYVSGSMFSDFGLHPALGRLLTDSDDRIPKASPYAVLSYDYWSHRFGRDPNILGNRVRIGDEAFEIVGVVDGPFTGTDRGTVVDIFLPAMMNRWASYADGTWIRTFALIRPGVEREPLRQKLESVSRSFEIQRLRGAKNVRRELLDRFINQRLELDPAPAGNSNLQSDYRRSLNTLGILVALVLLIACANVANLMTAQSAARAQEMALRVSIGAGRSRLLQLVLVQSAMLAAAAASLGSLLAWWAAPVVVGMINPPDDPARLALPADWRVLAFGFVLIAAVMLLFGLMPAWRASSVKPVSALKGGEDPHSRRRMMHAMIVLQVAFCFLVVFVSGLFVASFTRLANRPMGFDPDRLLLLETVAHGDQLPVVWSQAEAALGGASGVEKASINSWSLLAGGGWNGFVAANGDQFGPTLAYALSVSPNWREDMRIPLRAGRDFRESDTSSGPVLVNETFVKTFYAGQAPLGRTFGMWDQRFQIVGIVGDAPYRSLREPILPNVFLPFNSVDSKGAPAPQGRGTFVIRTVADNPLALASMLRQQVAAMHAGLRISNVSTQAELIRNQTLRERLLAMMAFFFACVALLLAGIGLYGVLNYSVIQRRREIGIRMAVGAQRGVIARLVTAEIVAMIAIGACTGVALGLGSARYIESLFYQVRATDADMLSLPVLAILLTSAVATLPAVLRAVRTNPTEILRAE